MKTWKTDEKAGKIRLGKVSEKLNDLQIKQMQRKAFQNEQIAAILSSIRKQERMYIVHGTQDTVGEENMDTLVQGGEKERQELENKKVQLLEERSRMNEAHLKEEETLWLQISNAEEMESLKQY